MYNGERVFSINGAGKLDKAVCQRMKFDPYLKPITHKFSSDGLKA